MGKILSQTEETVLKSLCFSQDDLILDDLQKTEFLKCANAHNVLSLIEAVDPIRQEVISAQKKAVYQYYRLLFYTRDVIELLKRNGIKTAVLKGASTARYYPVSEYRKSGDIDLILIDRNRIVQTKKILLDNGFFHMEEKTIHHHEKFVRDGIELEIHTSFNEAFDDRETNTYLERLLDDLGNNIIYETINGVTLPVLKKPYEALSLLLHMLSHFLRSGFGLKLLVDWSCFWNTGMSEDEAAEYEQMIKEGGLTGFDDLITSTCVYYLGLKGKDAVIDKDTCEEFLKDVFKGEEFGKSEKDRMVMLRGTSLSDYLREFHHQMHINFPKAGNYFILWPFLWAFTFIRFVYNNLFLRHTSFFSIMKKAKERSRYMEKIKLFDHGKKQS